MPANLVVKYFKKKNLRISLAKLYFVTGLRKDEVEEAKGMEMWMTKMTKVSLDGLLVLQLNKEKI